MLLHEVDDRVRHWHMQASSHGLPAHITLLLPFNPLDDITDQDLQLLADVFAPEPIAPVVLVRTGRFPGVLYLEPADESRFRRLIDELTELWPDLGSYGGRFDEVIPHLTVALGLPEDELDQIERELVPHLPFAAFALEASLMTFDGEEWNCEASFPFRENASNLEHE